MFNELFDILDTEYRLENISLIAENLDHILKLTDEYYLKDGNKQDQAIDAVVATLLKYKKFEKKAPPQNFELRSHCC